MALTVNTNVASLNVQKSLAHGSDALSASMTRLTSNLRINSAKDEVAAISIADKLKSQMQNSNRQIQSSMDTISLLQTADGALNETHSMLVRMKDLASHSTSSDSDSNRSLSMQSEFAELAKNITNIGNTTSFNGRFILNGPSEIETQSTAFFAESRSIKVNDMRSEALGVSDLSISTVADGREAISKIDEALKLVNEQRAAFGKEQNHIEHTVSSLSTSTLEKTTSTSRINDLDFATETAALTRNLMLSQAGTSILAQANSLPNNVLQLLRG